MQRTQISLKPDQHEALSCDARQRGISLSALIRLLVDKHYAQIPEQPDSLECLTGIAEGSGEYVARQHNTYLYGDKET